MQVRYNDRSARYRLATTNQYSVNCRQMDLEVVQAFLKSLSSIKIHRLKLLVYFSGWDRELLGDDKPTWIYFSRKEHGNHIGSIKIPRRYLVQTSDFN